MTSDATTARLTSAADDEVCRVRRVVVRLLHLVLVHRVRAAVVVVVSSEVKVHVVLHQQVLNRTLQHGVVVDRVAVRVAVVRVVDRAVACATSPHDIFSYAVNDRTGHDRTRQDTTKRGTSRHSSLPQDHPTLQTAERVCDANGTCHDDPRSCLAIRNSLTTPATTGQREATVAMCQCRSTCAIVCVTGAEIETWRWTERTESRCQMTSVCPR